MASESFVRAAGAGRDRDWHVATIVFLVITSLVRLALLRQVELSADEAYYWEWSRRLSLGYYDQGPLIAYLIRVTTAVFGTNELGVRFGVWAASLGTLVCVYLLARRFTSARAAFLAVLFLALTPLVAVGSLVATYDPPLVLFWSLALVALERALFAARRVEAVRGWLLAGLWCGLGLLSKHTMLLIVPCLLLFLALSPPHRHWLARPLPYLAFLLTLAMYSGVMVWNAKHHWWTFGHLLFLAGKNNGTLLKRFGDLFGGQAVLLGPGLFIASLWVFCRRGVFGGAEDRRNMSDLPDPPLPTASAEACEPQDASRVPGRRARSAARLPVRPGGMLFLFCFGVPVFLFFCLVVFKAKVQANWAPCAWLTPAIALAIVLVDALQGGGAKGRRAVAAIWAVAGSSGALTGVLLAPPLRHALGVRQRAEDDIDNRTYGARQMAAEVASIRAGLQREGRPVFIASNDYQTCALLSFYLPDHPRTYDLFLYTRINEFAVDADDLRRHVGENAVFVDTDMSQDEALREQFESVEWSGPFPVWRRPYFREPIRVHFYARCRGFKRYLGTTRAVGG
ncbi:MAG TPA: glycosyltransferase family 39 protein [Chthonomonadaceae bacterium]|nr:glycosyltransferase family 39 protein [Chthonomonadaceae bacterium]